MHIFIPKNIKGRDFVVGDIHGHYDLLKTELKTVGFDKQKDRLFSVGDIIDRGPKSEECLTLLDQPWFFMVLDDPDSKASMVWGRRILRGQSNAMAINGIDITIHGHTPLEFPQWVKNRYFMDTGAWYSDVLTLRNIEDIYNEHNYKYSVFG